MAVKVLDESGFDFADLTHVAAGRGPGSFTGIRVALAAGVGLSQTCLDWVFLVSMHLHLCN